MDDTHYWDESSLAKEELEEGVRLASQELREWLSGGFEQDLKRRGAEIAAQKKRGEYLATKDREQFAKAFQPDANPGEVKAINERLNQLYAKPSLNKQDDQERKELTARLQSLMKRYGNSSSKKPREW